MSAAVDVLRIAENPEAEFLSLWSNAPHAFVLCRADGAISSFNPATQQLLGRNPYSHPVVRFLDLIPLRATPASGAEIHALMEGMRTSFQIDTRTSGLNACVVRWTAWRLQGDRNAFLAFAEEVPDRNRRSGATETAVGLGEGFGPAGVRTSRNGSRAAPEAYSATWAIIEGTRLKVWRMRGNSSRSRAMP